MSDPPITTRPSRRRLRPWQFGMRGMLALLAVVSVLFAILGAVGPMAQVVIIWLVVLILGHIWATAVGATVRESANRLDEPPPPRYAAKDAPAITPDPGLRRHTRLGRRPVLYASAGAVVGGFVGAVALSLNYWDQASYAGLVLGTVSTAAIGGFLGFLASSFLQVALGALNEAAAASPPGPAPDLTRHEPAQVPTPPTS